MSAETPDTPPAYFRAVVVCGAATLLIGFAGMLWLPPWIDAAAEPARVHLLTTGTEAGLEVEARWSDEEGKRQRELGTPAHDEMTWLFHTAPTDRPVVLVVVRRLSENEQQEIKHEEGLLKSGAVFELRAE